MKKIALLFLLLYAYTAIKHKHTVDTYSVLGAEHTKLLIREKELLKEISGLKLRVLEAESYKVIDVKAKEIGLINFVGDYQIIK